MVAVGGGGGGGVAVVPLRSDGGWRERERDKSRYKLYRTKQVGFCQGLLNIVNVKDIRLIMLRHGGVGLLFECCDVMLRRNCT